ncbi:chromate transporter [Treponema putidum]|uniref:chromate transporter n=1 Tax=Treponema putidum TaxID=221027 RepID=UPI003D8B3A98
MSLIALFFLFMYIGLCSIGGGLVSITLMQQELISRGLISSEDFFAMVAISESTPGPMGINMATYVGYELYGILGSVVLTTGIVLPSLVVIVLIARFASAFQEKPLVKKSFYGLRAGSVGMIAVACWQVINISILNLPVFRVSGKITDIVHIKQFAFFGILFFVSLFFKKLHPIVLVAAGALFGVLFL